MPPDAARVRRLQRLEKVRAMAKRTALAEAAQAEGTLTQLETLAERTLALAEGYRGRTAFSTGLDLRQVGQFVLGLADISDATRNDADRARIIADQRQQQLALAERRRAAVEDRITAGQRSLELRRQLPVIAARRPVGTELE